MNKNSTTNGNAPVNEDPASRILRLSRFAEERRRLMQLKDELASCPHWPRAADLAAALDETIRDIGSLEEKLDAKAIVAVVGGTGTGKSSLVNALCGRPEAVRVGVSRPTTRKATAIVRSVADAQSFTRTSGPDALDILPVPETALPGAILVDTPDTDSTECASYADVLDGVLGIADVLVCVFDATNPKRKDNLDRLSHSVAKFRPRHVVLVLNHADRIVSRERLREDIVPDFLQHLKQCWPGAFDAVFCTATPPAAMSEALAGFDNDLGKLADFLRSVTGSSFVDERVSRAAFLRENAEEGIRTAIREQGDWRQLSAEICEFEKDVSRRMAEVYSSQKGDAAENCDTPLLRAVAARWWGPVGLFFGFSRRFRRFVETPFRAADLILPIALLRRIRMFAGEDRPVEAAPNKPDESPADELRMDDVEEKTLQDYATLSDRMVRDFGMDPALRDPTSALVLSDLSGVMRRTWADVRDAEIRDAARRCSGLFFQLVLNACSIVPAGYILCVVASTFLRGVYLSGAFYRQGLFLLALIWLLSSWIAQLRLKAAAHAIPGRTAKRFANGMHKAQILPVASEIARIARLATDQTETIP